MPPELSGWGQDVCGADFGPAHAGLLEYVATDFLGHGIGQPKHHEPYGQSHSTHQPRNPSGPAPPPPRRWHAARKAEAVLRLLRGESLAAVSRELALPIARLEAWLQEGLAGLHAGLSARPETDPVQLSASMTPTAALASGPWRLNCSVSRPPARCLFPRRGRSNERLDPLVRRLPLGSGPRLFRVDLSAFDLLRAARPAGGPAGGAGAGTQREHGRGWRVQPSHHSGALIFHAFR